MNTTVEKRRIARLKKPGTKLTLLLVFSLLPISLTCFIGRSAPALNVVTPQGALHILSIPYYSIKDDWASVLTLNNSAHESLTASVTLYSLSGKALPLPDVSLREHQNVRIQLRDLITLLPTGREQFQEGSIELRFNNNDGMALAPQLTVSDSRHGLSFDMEPPMGLKSSDLEGLWWSPDDKTDGLVALSNTTPGDLTVKLGVEWQSVLIPAPSFSLASHQTVVIEIRHLLASLNISSKGIDKGGLSVSHNGAPGALIAQGVIFNKEGRFASNINFVDPKAQKNSVLNGTGLMVGRPAAGLLFPENSYFTPQLTLKNIEPSSQKATVTVSYTADGETRAKVLPPVNLSSHEVRAVDFKPLLTEVLTAPISSAGVEIEASGSPGTLIASLSSIDQSFKTVVDVPLVSRSERSAEGGNHPFAINEDFRSMFYMTNITQKETKVLVAIFHGGGVFTPELLKVGPGETITVDPLQLRNGHIKDVRGRILPGDLSTGQVLWRPHKGESLIGRVVTVGKDGGTVSSFGCPNCCTYEPHQWVGSPDPFRGPPGGSQQMTLYEYGSICGCCFTGPYLADGILNIRSDNTSVATVTPGGMVSFISEGSANIVYSIQYWHSTFISSEDCGSEAIDVEVPCPIVVAPTVTSISPARGLQGMSDLSITINGSGFDAGATVDAGSGITVSVDQVTPTVILATFTIAPDAAGGNHPIVVTVRNQPSNSNVNFFVQIPTRLRRDSNGGLTNEEGGCGVTRLLTYTLLDQGGQPILSDDTIKENLTNYMGPPNTEPDEKTVAMQSGVFDDRIGYTIPECPPPFTATLTQTFTVTVGMKSYNLTTVNSITMGRNASGTKFVTVTNTTP